MHCLDPSNRAPAKRESRRRGGVALTGFRHVLDEGVKIAMRGKG